MGAGEWELEDGGCWRRERGRQRCACWRRLLYCFVALTPAKNALCVFYTFAFFVVEPQPVLPFVCTVHKLNRIHQAQLPPPDGGRIQGRVCPCHVRAHSDHARVPALTHVRAQGGRVQSELAFVLDGVDIAGEQLEELAVAACRVGLGVAQGVVMNGVHPRRAAGRCGGARRRRPRA